LASPPGFEPGFQP